MTNLEFYLLRHPNFTALFEILPSGLISNINLNALALFISSLNTSSFLTVHISLLCSI